MNHIFYKMQALGNDFVVIDGTVDAVDLSAQAIKKLADRRYGVGCDQVLILHPAKNSAADFSYSVFNADASAAEQCGNGVRALALYIKHHQLSGKSELSLLGARGIVKLSFLENDQVQVNLGVPTLAPEKVPFLANEQAVTYPLETDEGLAQVCVLNLGNPHAVVMVSDLQRIDVSNFGAKIASLSVFPEGVNVGFAQIVARDRIDLQVFERGAGATLGCGTGAGAAVVAGRLQGLVDERVCVTQPGGELWVSWAGAGAALTEVGTAAEVFRGEWLDGV